MSLVSAGRQQLMLIAGYAQEVSSRCKNRRNRTRTHVDHSLTCYSEENSKVLGRQNVVDGVQLYRHSSVPARRLRREDPKRRRSDVSEPNLERFIAASGEISDRACG